MLTLPSDVSTALQGNDIWTTRLVSLQIGDTTYYISDHYLNLTVDGNTYLPNGNLLSVGDIQSAIDTNDNSIDLSLSGIDSAFRTDILAADSIGGEVNIKRGLISTSSGLLLGTPIDVFQGFIFQVAITDENPTTTTTARFHQSSISVSVELRSSQYLLETTPGRFTEEQSNKQVDPTDESMNLVPSLNGVNLRFGGQV